MTTEDDGATFIRGPEAAADIDAAADKIIAGMKSAKGFTSRPGWAAHKARNREHHEAKGHTTRQLPPTDTNEEGPV